MEKVQLDTLVKMANELDFENFNEELASLLPTSSQRNREEAKEIYELLKSGADRDTVMNALEQSLAEREKEGIGKGVALGLGVAALTAGLLYLLKEKED